VQNWEPISLDSINKLLTEELGEATPEGREFFARTSVPPVKWQLSPWGDPGGGFWVVAVMDDRVLWYNDIEEGFNVSRFTEPGSIPATEYWCNQDELQWALAALAGKPHGKFGPPEPLIAD
jgi:hypothetical protein